MRSFALKCVLFAILALAAPACASKNALQSDEYDEQWAANGYFGPLRSREPEIIGVYASKRACEDALSGWLASQVVGMAISGECLPVDRN